MTRPVQPCNWRGRFDNSGATLKGDPPCGDDADASCFGGMCPVHCHRLHDLPYSLCPVAEEVD